MGYKAALITLSSLAIATLIPPSVYHIRAKNIPAFLLILWLLAMDLKTLVDASLWSGEDFYVGFSGKVYCDIVIKLQVGANVGISCCVTGIMYNLYRILRADSVIPDNSSVRKVVTDLLITCLTPVVVMGLNYLVQARRYLVARYSGCQTPLSLSYMTVVVYTVWMVVWAVIGVVYAGLIIFVFFRKRKDVQDILRCTNSGLSLAKFSRLLAFCVIIVLVMFPVSLYSFISGLSNVSPHYSFSEIHSKVFWNGILFAPSSSPAYFCWVYIALSYVVFVFFGLGADSIAMYLGFLSRVGFRPVIERARRRRALRRQQDADRLVAGALGWAGAADGGSILTRDIEAQKWRRNPDGGSTLARDTEAQVAWGRDLDAHDSRDDPLDKSPTSTVAVSNVFSDRHAAVYGEGESEGEGEGESQAGVLNDDDISYIRMLCGPGAPSPGSRA